jgi:two-component system KDP operon response regulator KdpE
MKNRHKVLIVDDEPQIRRLIVAALSRADYTTIEAANAREALAQVREQRPDVVLLDLGLPDRDGLELVPLIKQQPETTLIVVSAREATEEKVAALDLGADDYLTKPFDTDELLARVRLALRHRLSRDGGSTTLTIGDVTIDVLNRRIVRAREEVHLTPKEFAILAKLAAAPGRVVTHKQIMDAVWPHGAEHRVEYLRVMVRGLRQKLERDPRRPQLICNELGIGYRLQMDAGASRQAS